MRVCCLSQVLVLALSLGWITPMPKPSFQICFLLLLTVVCGVAENVDFLDVFRVSFKVIVQSFNILKSNTLFSVPHSNACFVLLLLLLQSSSRMLCFSSLEEDVFICCDSGSICCNLKP